MIRSRAICLLLAGLCAAAASAQDAPIDCDNAVTQTDMNICSYEEFTRADAVLNDVYAWAMERARSFENGSDTALREAQRAWIPYRDAACNAEGQLYQGGSIRPLIETSCMTTLTMRRTEDMRAAYEEY